MPAHLAPIWGLLPLEVSPLLQTMSFASLDQHLTQGGRRAPTGTLRVCSQAAEQVTMQATLPRLPCFPRSPSPPQFKPGVGGRTCTNSRILERRLAKRRVKGPLQTEILPWGFWGQVEGSGNSGGNTWEARRWPPSRKARLPWCLGQRL